MPRSQNPWVGVLHTSDAFAIRHFREVAAEAERVYHILSGEHVSNCA